MGTHTEVVDSVIANAIWRRKKKDETLVIPTTIADNFVITADFPPVIALFAAGARDVLLPADDAAIRGMRLTIVNLSVTAAGVLTLKNSADAALVPAITVAINAAVELVYLGGSSTATLGWRKVG